MTSQNCLINLKLNPSGPGLVSLPQLQTALLISSSWKCSTNMAFCYESMVLNLILFRVGLWKSVSWNLCEKNLLTSSLTSAGSSFQTPPTSTPFKLLDRLLEFIIKWKYLELQSPSLIHLDLAFCRNSDSWVWAASQTCCCNFFLSIRSLSSSGLSADSSSILFNSSSNLLKRLKVSPKWSLFHSFIFYLRALSLFFIRIRLGWTLL